MDSVGSLGTAGGDVGTLEGVGGENECLEANLGELGRLEGLSR
jgi:hypothetical protein